MAWLALGALTRELRDGELVVGSGADADWRIPTADLMPRHFVLTVHGLNVSIRPSNADNVVVVKDRQLSGAYHLLNDGDVILAGRGRFTFTDDAPAEPGAAGAEFVDASDEPFLVEEQGGTAYRLINRSTTIGRDVSNGIVVPDPRASRFHAEVRREAGGFALHSMGAAGTSLNGRPMTAPQLLREGDRIEIAYTTLRFSGGPLPQGTDIGENSLGLNDAAGVQDTIVRPRSTMESAIRDTEPPRPVMTAKVVLAIVVVAAVAIVLRILVAG